MRIYETITQLINTTFPEAAIKSILAFNAYYQSPADFTPDFGTVFYGDFNICRFGSLEIYLDSRQMAFATNKTGSVFTLPVLFENCVPTKVHFRGYKISLVRGIVNPYATLGDFSNDFTKDFFI